MNARDAVKAPYASSARDAILAAIRSAGVPYAPPAAPVVRTSAPEDLLVQFQRMLRDVGGTAVLSNGASIDAMLTATFGAARGAAVVVVGRFAVAENGAVYVDASDLRARTDVVSTEQLVIVVSAASIVETMHEAMPLVPRGSSCGWFLSGPSKTADIEQSLVIGAQGSKTLHVFLTR